MVSPNQERHWHSRVSPVVGHQGYEGLERTVYQERLKKVNMFRSKKRQLKGMILQSTTASWEHIEKTETHTKRQRVIIKVQQQKFQLHTFVLFFLRVVKHCNRCPEILWDTQPCSLQNVQSSTAQSPKQPLIGNCVGPDCFYFQPKVLVFLCF